MSQSEDIPAILIYAEQPSDQASEIILNSDSIYQTADGNQTITWHIPRQIQHPLEQASFTTEAFNELQIQDGEVYKVENFQEDNKHGRVIAELTPTELDSVTGLISLSNNGKSQESSSTNNSELVETHLKSFVTLIPPSPKKDANLEKQATTTSSTREIRITKYEGSKPPVTSGWLPKTSVIHLQPKKTGTVTTTFHKVTTIIRDIIEIKNPNDKSEPPPPQPQPEPKKIQPEIVLDISKGTHCNLCNKTFSTIGYYKQHCNAHHSGDRPFKCRCGKKFADKNSLDTHQAKHNDDMKDFTCPFEGCNRKFRHKNDAKRHATTHQLNTNACEQCGKCFMRGDHLRKHYMSHAKKVLKGKKKAVEAWSVVEDKSCNEKILVVD